YGKGAHDVIGDRAVGKPYQAYVSVDDDGGGHGWYFDPNPADSTEFTQPVTPSMARGNLGGREDFYTTILREIGKAVGINVQNLRTEFSFYANQIFDERGLDPVGTQYQLYASYFFDRITGQYRAVIFTDPRQ